MATGAVSAAAHAWVATGGKPYDFLTSLAQHLGATSAARRAAFASAALTRVSANGNSAGHKGVSSALVTFSRILLSTPSSSSAPKKPSKKNVPESSEYHLAADEAFATLTTTFQQFPWQPRINALRKLLKHSIDKKTGGTAVLAPKILRLALQQMAATASASTADLNSAPVQKALKGTLVTAVTVLATIMQVRPAHPCPIQHLLQT